MNEIESSFVKPFYLKMMGLNALHVTDELWASLIVTGRTVAASDVRWMLRAGHWRPVVMGAWFSLAVPAESVMDDLLTAMSESKGSLTAPPLAAAATLVAARAAVPAMVDYINFMVAPGRRDGSEAIVAASVEYLGSDPVIALTDETRRMFRDIHDVAIRVREAFARP
jgi:hypothetical protein